MQLSIGENPSGDHPLPHVLFKLWSAVGARTHGVKAKYTGHPPAGFGVAGSEAFGSASHVHLELFSWCGVIPSKEAFTQKAFPSTSMSQLGVTYLDAVASAAAVAVISINSTDFMTHTHTIHAHKHTQTHTHTHTQFFAESRKK